MEMSLIMEALKKAQHSARMSLKAIPYSGKQLVREKIGRNIFGG
jgi:hypothetical protein